MAEGQGRLDRQLFRGIAWTAVFRWVTQFFSWIGTFYAARLLSPGDYGLVAMATVPIGLLRIVEDFGLDAVLVQDRQLGRDQLARLAGLAVLVGLTISGVFLVGAEWIAAYYREPLVAALISALSVTFVLDALQVLPRAMLQRQLRFRTLAAVTAVQFLITSATLVVCARLGLGVWSLVLNTLVGGIVVTGILFYLSPYPLAWPRGIASIARPILAGWRILASRACWYGYSNADQLIIGRVLGRDPLGAYNFAMTFSALPAQEVTSVVSRVVPGVFTEVQSRRDELRRYFLLLTEAMTYLAFPAAFGLALTADHVVAIALGPKYEAVVEPLRILCLYQTIYAAQVLVSHVLMWTGNFRANMWFTVLALGGLLVGFGTSVRFGIDAVAWSWVVVFPLVNLPPLALAGRLLGLKLREFFRVLVPATVGCAVMCGVVLLVRESLPPDFADSVRRAVETMLGKSLPAADEVALLAVDATAGALAYVAFLALFYRRRVLTILRTAFASRG
jgi:teichuronic acid exporter